MAQFKSGDLVVLKSGGPTMTIDTVNTDVFDDDKVTGLLCAWFVDDVMMRVRFDHRAVRLATPAEIEAPSGGAGRHGGGTIAGPAVPRPLAATPSDPVAASATEPALPTEATAAAPGDPSTAEPPSQASADYAVVLDTMVGAMNALIEITAPTPARRSRAKPTVRMPARKTSTTTH